MTVALTASSYFVVGVVLYYAGLFVASRFRQQVAPGPEPVAFAIFVAALNEEAVIGATIDNLLDLDHDRFVVCVADDASSDRTAEIIATRLGDPRVILVSRTLPTARTGKSDVLNACMAEATRLVTSPHEILGGCDPSGVVVGIVDADGRLDRDTLRVVAPYFGDSQVASVQIGVRIANAATNLLTRMQDMEFVGFSAFVQRARDHVGSSGLGGNGQFTRLSALIDLKEARGGPWKTDALTEDLELGLALVCRGWRTRFCAGVYVAQQGLPGWRALFRQRTRWIQGHYKCWRYLPKLVRAPAGAMTRIDLSLYLVLIVTVLIVSFGAVMSALMVLGLAHPHNEFLAFLPAGRTRNLVSLTIGLMPLAMFMFVYQRNALRPFRLWELPSAGVAFTLYTYVWVFATLRALARNVGGRHNWVKTPRVADPIAVSGSRTMVTR